MKSLSNFTIILLLSISSILNAQNDSIDKQNANLLEEYKQKFEQIEQQRLKDSVRKAELEKRIEALNISDLTTRQYLQKQLTDIERGEAQLLNKKKKSIDSLRTTAVAYPVVVGGTDTIYQIYTKLGASTPRERADNISKKIKLLVEDDFFRPDSLLVIPAENAHDIVYGEIIVASISETDAMWYDSDSKTLANSLRENILLTVQKAKDEKSVLKLLKRIGLVLLVLILAVFLFRIIRFGFRKALEFIDLKKDKWLRKLAYKDYTFLTEEQELSILLFLFKIFRWFVYAILLYITLPIIFSIFPFTKGWADTLFGLIWSPFKVVLIAVWEYLPNLFSILVIYIVMKYFIRFVKYIFSEIESGNLKISGFHADWAMPTYSILRFLLYAFMFIMIFPYLPGSDSDIFKGVSVFMGVLFSLGSSSAIANIVAGLVITYMRPFKIGDRIHIGDATGIVLEKTLLVTRMRNIRNEIITIPNSSLLTGNTVNYSTEAEEKGLIIHTSVTIGYDVPWRDMHQVLIDAANKTNLILNDPPPFVWQTSLEDFYVSYQINCYTNAPTKVMDIYSELHQHIQDICNERGIEIMSPHYRAGRDGSQTTIPADYLPKDYKAPGFNVNVTQKK
ncbi:MAG: mechanosensitive ion channel [Paludibacter sp.]|jgi:small-conductance mechanosensitive channel|nr:mechanosensitive ion channel [Paludibacter sp.]